MRKQIRLWILFALFVGGQAAGLAQELSPARPEEVGISSARLACLDAVLGEALERKDFPGAVLLVSRKGRIVWRKAYGESQWVPERRPMDATMIFDLASITKPVATATSIMILVERGKIRLSDQVKDYVAGFSPYSPNGGRPQEAMRLWHLLTHTSGLPRYLEAESVKGKYGNHCSTEQLVQMIAGLKKESPPGKTFIYSCLNYIILGYLINEVSGKNVAEFAAENIFKPLGLQRTFFNPPPEFIEFCVPTQVYEGKPLRGIVHDPLARLQGGISGNAGLFSTADDLAVFAQMMLNGGAYGRTRILSPLSVKRMTEIFPKAKDSGHGLGWDVDSEYATIRGDLFGASSYGHSGYTGTSIWIDPETQTSVILLTNRVHPDDKGNIISIRSKISTVVAASILEP